MGRLSRSLRRRESTLSACRTQPIAIPKLVLVNVAEHLETLSRDLRIPVPLKQPTNNPRLTSGCRPDGESAKI